MEIRKILWPSQNIWTLHRICLHRREGVKKAPNCAYEYMNGTFGVSWPECIWWCCWCWWWQCRYLSWLIELDIETLSSLSCSSVASIDLSLVCSLATMSSGIKNLCLNIQAFSVSCSFKFTQLVIFIASTSAHFRYPYWML